MKSFEIRNLFLDFFKRRGHRHIPGSSLIPQDDPSLLFVNAGMNQFKPVFLGLKKPPAQNVVTLQKCLRAGGKHNDLENVGQTPRHHTFFEMMGNFSFGGYFKKEALQFAWEFLTKALRLPEERLWITVFEEDGETENLWREEIKIPPHKILKCGEQDNFWRMGASGPCGPCSEIHYYGGPKARPSLEDLTEIWNLVFMEFNEDEKGNRTPLPVKCVDTGMGLERITALMQNKQSNYHTDLFQGIIQALEKESGLGYDRTEKSRKDTQTAFRVLADHSRAVAFLMSDGLLPGNEGRDYVLRRLIRRALFYGNKLNPNKNLLKTAVREVTAFMGPAYPELLEFLEEKAWVPLSSEVKNPAQRSEEVTVPAGKEGKSTENKTSLETIKPHIQTSERMEKGLLSRSDRGGSVSGADGLRGRAYTAFEKSRTGRFLDSEAAAFDRNLKEGKKRLFQKMESLSLAEKLIDAGYAWHLYSTYGFPVDLTRLIAKEEGWRMASDEEIEDYRQIEQQSFLYRSGLKIQGSDCLDSRVRGNDGLHNHKKQKPENSYKTGITAVMQKEHRDLLQNLPRILKGRYQAETVLTCYEKEEEEGHILHVFPSGPGGFGSRENVSAEPGLGLRIPVTISDASLQKGEKGWVVLDKTCFYPAREGLTGDKGELQTKTGKARALNCRYEEGFAIHEVEVTEGEIKAEFSPQIPAAGTEETKCKIKVDKTCRNLIQEAQKKSIRQGIQKTLPPDTKTKFTGYEKDKEEGCILLSLIPSLTDLSVSSAPLKKNGRMDTGWLVLDKTCFYPEGGGPVGDRGELQTETGKATALDCQKYGDFIVHKVKALKGELKAEQPCQMRVSESHRRAIKAGHSATHLLHKALREVLGDGVRQAGSLIDAEKLRFDFTHPKPLTERQMEEIENQVRADIQSQSAVSAGFSSLEEAKKNGALFLAGENYADQVRVITMGRSRELCGGIHVKNTSEIGPFKIISETGVKSGVRRITAYTGDRAEKQLNSLADQNRQIREWMADRAPEFSGEARREAFDKTKKRTALSVPRGTDNPLSEKKPDNPFISWFEEREEEIKRLKNQLRNLIPPKISPFKKPDKNDKAAPAAGNKNPSNKYTPKKSEISRERAVCEILELQKRLKLSPSGKSESENPFIPLMERKMKELKSLERQVEAFPWKTVTVDKLKKPSVAFQLNGIEAWLVIRELPVTDRKVLADATDQLKLKISSGVAVIFGAGEGGLPVAVAVTRNLQKHISAGDLLKNIIAPLLGGKGGGPPRFAQGVITDKSRFPELQQTLLSHLKKKPD